MKELQIAKLNETLDEIRRQKNIAFISSEYEKAAKLRYEETLIIKQLEDLNKNNLVESIEYLAEEMDKSKAYMDYLEENINSVMQKLSTIEEKQKSLDNGETTN